MQLSVRSWTKILKLQTYVFVCFLACRFLVVKAAFTRYRICLEPIRNYYGYTGPVGAGRGRICYLAPNGSTYEGDPIWNRTAPVLNRFRVNRVDPYHSGFDPKRI